jgi:hypothetical protein
VAQRLVLIAHYLSPDSILEDLDIEINQEAQSPSSDSKIGQQLRLMDRRESLNRFHFNCYKTVYEDIYSISAFEPNSLVLQWQGIFIFELDTSQG